MYRKISVILALFLIILFGMQIPVYGTFQTGIECQISDNRIEINTALVNYWFYKNLAVNVNYNWRKKYLSSSIIYKSKPLFKQQFTPYNGFGVRDLSGTFGREILFLGKLETVSGLELDFGQLIPGLSLAIEARIIPGNLINAVNNKDFGPILGVSVNLSGENATRAQTRGMDININERELYLLASLITAEAGNEPYNGQVAVGAVVLNRVKSADFPDSIHDVIYQPGQFSSLPKLPTITPSETCIKAAKEALAGKDPSGGALYFYNPLTSSPEGLRFFSTAGLQVTTRIGNHLFLK